MEGWLFDNLGLKLFALLLAVLLYLHVLTDRTNEETVEFPVTVEGLPAFHAGDDTVDDDFPLELGEYSEHLDQHSADRRGGVERFGGGSECHAGFG